MTEAKPVYAYTRRCRWCFAPLKPRRSGRRINPKRRYCNGRCRQAAYEARKRGLREADGSA